MSFYECTKKKKRKTERAVKYTFQKRSHWPVSLIYSNTKNPTKTH